ncbi:MAG: response regulator [Spirochaetota bacterium]|nr:MAG: response regulator [Spirochaetota bacterium]
MENNKVLVIDDEQIVLDSVKKILSKDHYEVDTALESRIGLKMALQNDYDIVLTDIRMPEIGGMRILRDIKRNKPLVPVIIITGYATVQSGVQAMRLGATNYIEKPFTPEELIEAVLIAKDTAVEEIDMEQKIIHEEEVIKVLERGIKDANFTESIYQNGVDALENYNLTGPEKLAILTGDIAWIEHHVGRLPDEQKQWLFDRLSGEIW